MSGSDAATKCEGCGKTLFCECWKPSGEPDAAPSSDDVDVTTGDDFERFLSRLREIATNWRYSDEFIGIYVRGRWAADYD